MPSLYSLGLSGIRHVDQAGLELTEIPPASASRALDQRCAPPHWTYALFYVRGIGYEGILPSELSPVLCFVLVLGTKVKASHMINYVISLSSW